MVVGFERNNKKQPDITFEARIVDETGKPTLALPIGGDINKDVPENLELLPMNFILPLNRAGKFTVEITAKDQVSKVKPAKLSFPITVVELK
jgi:hypothetical protein